MSEKTTYKPIKNPKSADEWDAQLKYLKQELSKAKKEQKKIAKQEEIQRKEEQRRQEVRDAFELIDFMKTLQLNNGSTAYEWITRKLEEDKRRKAEQAAAEQTDAAGHEDHEAENHGYYNQ